MEKRYSVEIINGKYAGMIGWTPDAKPNKYGNVMIYSYQSSYPYRVCKGAEDIKYLNNGKDMN